MSILKFLLCEDKIFGRHKHFVQIFSQQMIFGKLKFVVSTIESMIRLTVGMAFSRFNASKLLIQRTWYRRNCSVIIVSGVSFCVILA